MPRTCTICTHPDRDAIDRAVIAGAAKRRIAAQYGVTEQALRRHVADHLPQTLAQAQQAQDAARADRLLDELLSLHRRAWNILDQAERAGDLRTALAGVREARECLELMAKLMGELETQAQVNILVTPEWSRITGVLLMALQPYPEARLAVAKALEVLRAG